MIIGAMIKIYFRNGKVEEHYCDCYEKKNGLLTYYMHCNAIYVSAGQKVSRGQNVAAVGTTGNSTGPHLHFQVMLNGTPVNPANYL